MPRPVSAPGIQTLIDSVAVAVAIAVLGCLAAPEAADAALRSAAGGGGRRGGFARFVRFINRVADYAIPVGARSRCWG